MKDLIEALAIFLKYKNSYNPTHCEHDVLWVVDVKKDEVSLEDQKRLDVLGFEWSDVAGSWISYRFGRA